ncbi:hypothetical protein Taro_017063 [Colocasia esculenta]|uniref:Uncharacterized protein n=1 Tax=Colocasia esculenta TaxID=4460 RepID=A0A843UFC5_COLES|nr:hypothetical protein [Colocasia esculenta]
MYKRGRHFTPIHGLHNFCRSYSSLCLQNSQLSLQDSRLQERNKRKKDKANKHGKEKGRETSPLPSRLGPGCPCPCLGWPQCPPPVAHTPLSSPPLGSPMVSRRGKGKQGRKGGGPHRRRRPLQQPPGSPAAAATAGATSGGVRKPSGRASFAQPLYKKPWGAPRRGRIFRVRKTRARLRGKKTARQSGKRVCKAALKIIVQETIYFSQVYKKGLLGLPYWANFLIGPGTAYWARLVFPYNQLRYCVLIGPTFNKFSCVI